MFGQWPQTIAHVPGSQSGPSCLQYNLQQCAPAILHPDELPKQWRKDVAVAPDEESLARIVADYIAGMTDRFAIQEHGRLFGATAQTCGT